MKLDRNRVKIISSDMEQSEEQVILKANELISFVWELTKEVFSLTKKYNVESRLQRNVTNIIRK